MILSHLTEITAIVGVCLGIYSAILSTRNAFKDRVKVQLRIRSNMSEVSRSPRYGGKKLTIVTATNVGVRPVTIIGFGARTSELKTDYWFTDIQPQVSCELTEGQFVSAYVDQGDGKVKLVESWYVWDSTGRHFYKHVASRRRRLLSTFRRIRAIDFKSYIEGKR
jgi:hypothetical protein